MCSALKEVFRVYLGSKSTSMGLGGYCGRVLLEEIRSFWKPVRQSMRIISPSRFRKHLFLSIHLTVSSTSYPDRTATTST
ncbi:hypothetical protein B0H34DRAFT_725468 [Crassisporium funariophilum]|nr:hypothetical protein B0H34DRAFT_725468 [Crassisporium funariophilum]